MILSLAVVLLLSPACLAMADNSIGDQAHADSQPVITSSHDTSGLPRLKDLANNEVDRRLGSLNSLLNIVKNAKCISAADKTSLENQITSEQTNLPTIKTKIDGDTDDATEKDDVKSIFTDFRVYALIVPKVHLIRVADALDCADSRLTDYANKLQAHIDTAKASGKDVSSEVTTMTDMRAQIQTATSDFNSVVTTLIPLTPDQFNASPSIVSNMKATLDAGRQALIKALKDGNSIRDGLKSLGEI